METTEVFFDNYIRLNEIKKVFESLNKAVGLDIALYGLNGEEKLSVRNGDSVCSYAKNNANCCNMIFKSGQKSAELKKPYIYETLCGLISCIASVEINDVTIGYVSLGPVILGDRVDFSEDEFYKKCRETGIELDRRFSIDGIKNVTCEMMTGLADMLIYIVRHTVEKEIEYLEKTKKIKQQATKSINEYKQMQKRSAEGQYKRYPIELEKELISYVHLGDKENARGIINELLGEIFMYAGGDLEIIKAKLYELIAIFSRTAVEAGAKTENLSPIVKKSTGLFTENVDFQDLCCITVDILNEFLETVYQIRGGKKISTHLASTIALINAEYYNCDLNLEEVAKRVFVSPYYVSHLFSSELGMTFTNYLTKVRIEHAKHFLLEGYTSEETAVKVGYKDVFYFVKIFKKNVGITPFKFRQNER